MSDYANAGVSRRWVSGILVIMCHVIFWGPYLFGLGFSFYRFGASDGLFAVFIPPYAWYRGVSYIWVEPKWKEDWDLNAGNLAAILLSLSNRELEFERRQHEDELRKWLQRVPAEERNQLREDAESLGQAVVAYTREFMLQLSGTGWLDPALIDSPAVRRHVDSFRDQRGFMEVWEKFDTEQKYAIEIIQQEMAGRSGGADLEDLRLRMRDFMDLQGDTTLRFQQEQIEMRIKAIFDQ